MLAGLLSAFAPKLAESAASFAAKTLSNAVEGKPLDLLENAKSAIDQFAGSITPAPKFPEYDDKKQITNVNLHKTAAINKSIQPVSDLNASNHRPVISNERSRYGIVNAGDHSMSSSPLSGSPAIETASEAIKTASSQPSGNQSVVYIPKMRVKHKKRRGRKY